MDPRITMIRSMLTLTDFKRLRSQPFQYPDVVTLKNIKRKVDQGGGSDLPFDLYLPKNREKELPLIIDIHGGGLVYGNKTLNRWTAAEMARRGYAVAVLDYPLIPEADVHDQVQSILDAMATLDRLAVISLDRRRTFLRGDSAGGLLSLLTMSVLLDPICQRSFRIGHDYPIRGLALVHPMIRTRRWDILNFIPNYLPGPPAEAADRMEKERGVQKIPDQTRRILPTSAEQSGACAFFQEPSLVAPLLPATWMVSSRNDVMFNSEARNFAEELRFQGVPHRFNEFPLTAKAPLNHIFMITHPHLAESQSMYDDLDQFLREL